MTHPSLGLPPPSITDGHPDAARRLRANRHRLARLALENTIRLAPQFPDKYPELTLRVFLRDYERHVEQLARAMETGADSFLVNYAEWLVPVYRRRKVPMRDFLAMFDGLRHAAATVLSPEEVEFAEPMFERAAQLLKHHGRLPGDHVGNKYVRFFWKGAGILDDGVV
ncbi:MAG TPA: hypothetical protein VM305_00635 [Candidatus Limnocylindrales bacterium]|nr:hypothetical protein [Candidatus Limnocylindrales bacterium]